MLLFQLLNSESVTETSYCDQILRSGRVVLDLLTKPVDVYHNGIFVYNRLTPDNGIDHILGKYVVDIIDEKFDHRVLLG